MTELILQALTRINSKLDMLERDAALNGNLKKGTGFVFPYSKVLFLDGTSPSVLVPAQPAQPAQPGQAAIPAIPARPALPALTTVTSTRDLSAVDAHHYLRGHGVAIPDNPTQAQLQQLVASCVGCCALD